MSETRIPFEPPFTMAPIDLFEALLTWWRFSGNQPLSAERTNHIGPLVLTDEDLSAMIHALYEEVKA
jgi:hypothetical protein